MLICYKLMSKFKNIQQMLSPFAADKSSSDRKLIAKKADDKDDEGSGSSTAFKSQVFADILRGLGASPYDDPRMLDEIRDAVNNGHKAWDEVETAWKLREQSAMANKLSKLSSMVVGEDLNEPVSAAYFIASTKPATVVATDSSSDLEFDLDMDNDSVGRNKL